MTSTDHTRSDPTKSTKVTVPELMQAAPKTVVTGVSAFVGAWFGLDRLASGYDWCHTLRGLDGKTVIFEDTHFVNDLKSIVRTWKTDGNAGTFQHTMDEVTQTIRHVATRYGLESEAALVKQWSDGGQNSRQALWETLGAAKEKYPFFELFHDAIDPKVSRTGKSLERLEQNIAKITAFRKHQHQAVFNLYRAPVVVATTVAAMAAAAYPLIENRRKEEQFTERLTQLENTVSSLPSR